MTMGLILLKFVTLLAALAATGMLLLEDRRR
jgi:hypothetical protein